MGVSPPATLKSAVGSPLKIHKKIEKMANSEEFQPFKNTTMVNTLALKVFCVLFCRGTHKEKSTILFDAIIGPAGLKIERD